MYLEKEVAEKIFNHRKLEDRYQTIMSTYITGPLMEAHRSLIPEISSTHNIQAFLYFDDTSDNYIFKLEYVESFAKRTVIYTMPIPLSVLWDENSRIYTIRLITNKIFEMKDEILSCIQNGVTTTKIEKISWFKRLFL